MSTESIAIDVIVSYLEPGMYLIAACLPRLRALVSRLTATLSASLSSLLAARRRGASGEAHLIGMSPPKEDPDCDSARSRRSERNAPRVDIKLTGQGNLESLAMAEENIV